MPEGIFLRNHSGHNAIVNTMAVNRDNVLVSGADNGSIHFWDWNSGYCFQEMQVSRREGAAASKTHLLFVNQGWLYSHALGMYADGGAARKFGQRGWYLRVPLRHDWVSARPGVVLFACG